MPEIGTTSISKAKSLVWGLSPIFIGFITLPFTYLYLEAQPQALSCRVEKQKSLNQWKWCSNGENARNPDCQPILGKNYYDIERQHKFDDFDTWAIYTLNFLIALAIGWCIIGLFKLVFCRKDKAPQTDLANASEKLDPSSTSDEALPPDMPEQTIESDSSKEVVLPDAPEQTIKSGSSEEVLQPDAPEQMVQSGSSEEVFLSDSSSGTEENQHRWLEITPNQQHSKVETEIETEMFETASTQSSKPRQKKHTRRRSPRIASSTKILSYV
ncbi:hypothetical protein TWF102_003047 [Orbilia oligospora]|uniref:Uncharacterized protein n=1 Tax=Orbilia oligospora TaxID=2813651 RepID=A0A7C8J9I0_ORBOL|nr:hypothetical protein TWF102_003047 [Orbilia oligospora]